MSRIAQRRRPRASRLRWAATLTAVFYMLITLAMVWILPLFPAQPKLGPIDNPLDHMVPPLFPLLLIVPAAGMDWLLQRKAGKSRGRAVELALVFLALFFAAQWLFSEFLLSPASRNPFSPGTCSGATATSPGPTATGSGGSTRIR